MTLKLPPCPFEPGTPVIAYLRHSPGESQTIASQESFVTEWTQHYRLNLVRIFKDEWKSGTKTSGRDAFLEMDIALEEGIIVPKPKGIVIWSFDRWSREIESAEYHKWKLRHFGYQIVSLTDSVPDGELGPLFEFMLHLEAERRSKKISLDAKRGLHWLAAGGYSPGGFPPRGYRPSQPIPLTLNGSIVRRKNGEPRYAHKWEIDPEWESRVRRAWQMRLKGESLWTVHYTTKLFKGINGYPTFFRNRTYCGDRKCGELIIANAHPAYVTEDEFARVQAMKRPTRGNPRGENGLVDHSRRFASEYLLSGILFCVCGAAMVGEKTRGMMFYRCGRHQREGRSSCAMPRIKASYVNAFIVTWIGDNVLNLHYLRSKRDQINARLNGDKSELKERRMELEKRLASNDRRARGLLDALEVDGLTDEIRQRLHERQTEANQIKSELAGVNELLSRERIELSDDALELLAAEMKNLLNSTSPQQVKTIVRKIVPRAELDQSELRLYYFPPLLPKLEIGFKQVPPREDTLNPDYFLLEKISIPFPRPPLGAASHAIYSPPS